MSRLVSLMVMASLACSPKYHCRNITESCFQDQSPEKEYVEAVLLQHEAPASIFLDVRQGDYSSVLHFLRSMPHSPAVQAGKGIAMINVAESLEYTTLIHDTRYCLQLHRYYEEAVEVLQDASSLSSDSWLLQYLAFAQQKKEEYKRCPDTLLPSADHIPWFK